MRPGVRLTAHATLAVACAIVALLAAPTASAAALGTPGHLPVGVLGPVGDLFGKLVGAGLGAIDWTVELASKFLINTVGGFVKALIPDEWKDQALSVMKWIVAVPNYSAQVTAPGGSRSYGFSGVNELRDVMLFIGIGILPLTLTVAIGTRTFGFSEHPAVPLLRVTAIAGVMLSYTWIWSNGAALANQVSAAILGTPKVTNGLENLFSFLVSGAGITGLPLIGLLLMGVCGIYLLLMIFTKILVLLVGAIIYVIGPLVLGLSPTERGSALTTAWLSMVAGVLLLPVIWTIVFAVAAVLMFDAGDPNAAAIAGGGGSSIGKVFGGLLLGMAGIAGFWLNIKITKASASILTSQISALLTTAGASGSGGGGSVRLGGVSAARTVSDFRRTMSNGGSRSPMLRAAPLAAASAATGGGAAALAGAAGRSGAVGAGSAAAGSTAGAAAPATSSGTSGPRAAMVATRLARGGRAQWARDAQDSTGTAAAGSPTTASAAATRQVDPVEDPGRRPPTEGAVGTATSAPTGSPEDRAHPGSVQPVSGAVDSTRPGTSPGAPGPATPPPSSAGAAAGSVGAGRAAATPPGTPSSAPGTPGTPGPGAGAGTPTSAPGRRGSTSSTSPSDSTRSPTSRPSTTTPGGPTTAPAGAPAPPSAKGSRPKAPPAAPPPTPRAGRSASPAPRSGAKGGAPAPSPPADKPARRGRKAPVERDPFGRETPPKPRPPKQDR